LSEGRQRLPERYRDDRLHALAVDPSRMWVYWDEGTAIGRLGAAVLPDGWQEAPRRLHMCTGEGDERWQDVRSGCGSLYASALQEGGCYRVEYGVQLMEGFVPLLETQVRLPGTGVARLPWRAQHEAISSYSIYSKS
jgi:hypothetical protein